MLVLVVLARSAFAQSGSAEESNATLIASASNLSDSAIQQPGEQKVDQTPLEKVSKEEQSRRRSVRDIALSAAPILWFGDDEPLLKDEHKYPVIPAPIPCDGTSAVPVVYYRLDSVQLVKGARRPHQEVRNLLERDASLYLEDIARMRLTYFFYYPEDKGVNPHIHDVESASVDLEVIRDKKTGEAKIERYRVTGWGHGSELIANILQIKPSMRSASGAPDTRTPVTILVEEGKHASCPDRNGDGVYTPGIDVNVRVPDAWGVRDVFGGGVVGSRYRPEMTKGRLVPTLVPLRQGLEDLNTRITSLWTRLHDELHEHEKELLARIVALERLNGLARDAPAPPPGPEPAAAAGGEADAPVINPGRYRIGPALPESHPVRETYENERKTNGGLGYPTVTYEVRSVNELPQTLGCLEAPFPFRAPAAAVDRDESKRLDWEDQGHIFQGRCAEPDTDGEFKRCGYLNLPDSVAGLKAKTSVNRSWVTYKYGKWWPLQPFRNTFIGARYDRSSTGLVGGFYLGYGLPKFGGWFNFGGSFTRRDRRWHWSSNVWFTPSIATLATWYVGAGYENHDPAGDDRTGRFAIEGGVQVRYLAVGLRVGVRSTLSAGGLRNAGVVSEIVFGPATKGSRVH